VITPSHNPPDSGGFKYNRSNGAPADTQITGWIEAEANRLLMADPGDVRRTSFAKARKASATHRYDYLNTYVADQGNAIDMDGICSANVRMGVDPLGGAGAHYWAATAERYRSNPTVVDNALDPAFRFMTVAWDGNIRMDPSSTCAMQGLIGPKDRFDIAFACDTDHDRHGIVTRSAGLLPPNHYLSVAVDCLFQNRPLWREDAGIGKTVVSSSMIDRIASKLRRRLCEVPVGFKWFVNGLLDGSSGFGGEESAGAAFLRRDGTGWSTDKDGLVPALLPAELAARMGRNPGEVYRELMREFGVPLFEPIDAPATPAQKQLLSHLAPDQVASKDLAGEPILSILTRAPGNGAAIGGLKVIAEHGWFAARPSGTEAVYKIYAESCRGADHLRHIQDQAQRIVSTAFATTFAPDCQAVGKLDVRGKARRRDDGIPK
jgi:phosphoglucomutase